MAIPPKPIEVSDLIDFLEIESSFAFEMQVRELFASRRLRYKHGGSYDDPHTRTPRQFDLRADLNCSSYNVSVRILLAIECKSLSEYGPLLVYRSPRSVYEAGHQIIAHTCGDRNKIDRLMNRYMHIPYFVDTDGPFPEKLVLVVPTIQSRYKPRDYVGKSIDVVSRDGSGRKFKSGDGEVYGRWTQALQSGASILDSLVELRSPGQSIAFTWVLPILVIPDDRLFVVDFNDAGTRVHDPQKADRTSFYVDYHLPIYDYDGPSLKFGHFEIMTYSALREFIEGVTGEESKAFVSYQINEEACFETLSRF
jgi:hypothetical protein